MADESSAAASNALYGVTDVAGVKVGHTTVVTGEGPLKPSSESLTHGVIYELDQEVQWVMHAHSPHIWRQAGALQLPITDSDVTYGTPEMAAEVQRLFRETEVKARRIFSMGGHEDGIVSFGCTAEEAGTVLLTHLARALELD